MKTYIIAAVVVAVLGGGTFFYFANGKSSPDSALQTTAAKVERGLIRAVVSPKGKVVSNLDVDIKCKASGQIKRIPFDVSDTVKKGDLLVELDPVDMDRSLRQSEVELEASKARLVIAQRNLVVAEQTLQTDTTRAESALGSAQAKAKDARAKADRTKELYNKKLSALEEWETAETAAVMALAELKNAQVKLEELKTQQDALELKRQDVKLAQTAVEADQISVQVATDRRKDTMVMAPMDGVVSARTVQEGQIISSGITTVGGGTTIMTLSDLSRIFVYAAVDESDIGRVRLGQAVNITADGLPDMLFHGKVSRIATKGTNVSNVVTFEVQIEVMAESEKRRERPGRLSSSNPASGAATQAAGDGAALADAKDTGRRGRRSRPTADGSADAGTIEASADGPTSRPTSQGSSQRKFLLKPEMTTNVEIVVAEKEDAVIVPVEAVIRKAGQQFATLAKDGGATEDVPVTTGITDGTRIEIVSGLEPGQTLQIRKGAADSKWNGQRGPGGPNNPTRAMGIPGSGGGGGRGR